MDKQELQQLRKLRAESKDLKERIERNQMKPKTEVADTVKDYRTGQGKTIVIRGYGSEEWQKLQMKYKQKRGEIVARILMMEIFLDNVQDAEMREILRYRYEDGMTHAEVGAKMGYSRHDSEKRREVLEWTRIRLINYRVKIR